MKNILKRIKSNAKAYNKHMTKYYMDNLTIPEMLAFTHPSDRSKFVKELREHGVKINWVEREEV